MAVTFLTSEDEKNFVKSINGHAPDENGNVSIEAPGDNSTVTNEQIEQAVSDYLTEHPIEVTEDNLPAGVPIVGPIENPDQPTRPLYLRATGFDENGMPTEWKLSTVSTTISSTDENYVKTVNGIEPDENGNVEITITDSGGSADFVVQDTPPDDTSVLWVDPTDEGEDAPGGIAVTGAKVGQTVKIAEVDENGVPTAWESVDFPSEGKYEMIETFTTTEEVNSIYRDLPNCKALIVKYLMPGVDSITHLINKVGFTSNLVFGATLSFGTLNTTLGARLEIYPKNGYYTGTGYLPYGAYSNVGQAFAIPNSSVAVIEDTHYINSITMSGYNEKIIPVGTKIEILGVRA